MADEIDTALRQKKEYAMLLDRKEAKREAKSKNLVEM